MLHPNEMLRQAVPVSSPTDKRSLEGMVNLFRQRRDDPGFWEMPLDSLQKLMEVTIESFDDLLHVCCLSRSHKIESSDRQIILLPCDEPENDEGDDVEIGFSGFLAVGRVQHIFLRGVSFDNAQIINAIWLPQINCGVWEVSQKLSLERGSYMNATVTILAENVDICTGKAGNVSYFAGGSLSEPLHSARRSMVSTVDFLNRMSQKTQDLPASPAEEDEGFTPSLYDGIWYFEMLQAKSRKHFQECCGIINAPQALAWYDKVAYPLTADEVEHFLDLIGLSVAERAHLRRIAFQREIGAMDPDEHLKLPRETVDFIYDGSAVIGEWQVTSDTTSPTKERAGWVLLSCDSTDLDVQAANALLHNAMDLWCYLSGHDVLWKQLHKEGVEFTRKLMDSTALPD